MNPELKKLEKEELFKLLVELASLNKDKTPIAFHKGMYGQVTFNLPKPPQEERENIVKIVEKYKK